MKKFLMVLLALVFIITLPSTTKATEVTKLGLGITYDNDIKTGIDPFIVTSCPYGGNHQMKSCGQGDAYYGVYPDTSHYLCGSCAWQCVNCNLVMITEGEAPLGFPIGTYATYSPGYPVGSYTIIWTTTYGYSSSSTMSGYHFYY